MTIEIRHLETQDESSIVSILNHYIENTAITFDTELYSVETRKPWFNQFKKTGRHQCLVAVFDGQVVGYANSAPFRPKRAYDTSIEVSIYLKNDLARKGVGSMLYTELFNRLEGEDVHRAHALITLPNEKSINLHKKFGFEEVGALSEAGRKFERYHTVYLMEKRL
ncbi:GNAT family N-acetyltransferase [Reinekea marinisedimentorum]|uniref:Phosphinothricin acetyltransferase n=1 Tax=Reinekea marinisedimentorum TaxID=230495 RepID=A0A4R3IB72_9GAMM|nr:GNAT family N-acetyltransferase [Reinekea marinisedimentorum]TCS43850.1 phosphinothricin acetyltransferase [Reinekea marinisedimentorum]